MAEHRLSEREVTACTFAAGIVHAAVIARQVFFIGVPADREGVARLNGGERSLMRALAISDMHFGAWTGEPVLRHQFALGAPSGRPGPAVSARPELRRSAKLEARRASSSAVDH
jgi:hypothetical protein